MNSKRVSREAKVVNFRSPDYHVSQRLENIFELISVKIKRMEIASSVMCKKEVFKILNAIPNVEEISFYDVEFTDEAEDDDSEDLYLPKLKRFKFHLCNVKIPKIILKLPSCVLQSLSIESCILGKETLRLIFENQRNIQEIEFDPYYVEPSSMEHLKLNKMKLMCNRHVASLLRSQRQTLHTLDLSKAHIGDNEFLKICKLQNLKSVKLWIDRVSWENIENLVKLRNLNELYINYDRLEVEYMRNISRVRLPSVHRLKIKFPRLKISAENFMEMSLNMPSIKHLNISNQSIGVIGILIDNFKNLETLVIGCDSDSSEVVDFNVSGTRHDKLKDLCIYSSYADQKTLKCTKTILQIVNSSLKNLEKLKLQNVLIFSEKQLQDIFTNHQELSHVFIDNLKVDVSFDDDAFAILKENGKKLKYFQSRGAEILIRKKILEQEFCKQFSVIKIKPWKRQVVLRNCRWEHAED